MSACARISSDRKSTACSCCASTPQHKQAALAGIAVTTRLFRRIETVAGRLGLRHRRMTSGAGHDAQMLARICPAAMIFVPSVKGISHNPAEHTQPDDLCAGTNVLLQTLVELANDKEM